MEAPRALEREEACTILATAIRCPNLAENILPHLAENILPGLMDGLRLPVPFKWMAGASQ